MSGVWVFKNGVVRLVEKGPAGEQQQQGKKRKALVHVPTGETVASHEHLQRLLLDLGWERYHGDSDPTLVQFHHRGSPDLILLPADFARVGAVHMLDMVIKNRDHFKVVDVADPTAGQVIPRSEGSAAVA